MSLNFVSSSVLSSTDGVSHNTETPIENRGASNNHYNSLSHRSSSSQTPLFEQLRKNQQEAQDNYDEVTKAMRGTRTLDDEDVAHLQSVENVRVDRDREVRRNIDQELEMFRAAKMEKGMTVTTHVDDPNDNIDANADANTDAYVNVDGTQGQGQGLVEHAHVVVPLNEKNTSITSSTASLWPKIVVTKKRRRRVPHSLANTKQDGNCAKKIAGIGAELDSNSTRTKTGMSMSISMSMSTSTSTGMNQKEIPHTNNNNSNLVLPTDPKTNGKEVFGGLLGDYGSDDDSD